MIETSLLFMFYPSGAGAYDLQSRLALHLENMRGVGLAVVGERIVLRQGTTFAMLISD